MFFRNIGVQWHDLRLIVAISHYFGNLFQISFIYGIKYLSLFIRMLLKRILFLIRFTHFENNLHIASVRLTIFLKHGNLTGLFERKLLNFCWFSTDNYYGLDYFCLIFCWFYCPFDLLVQIKKVMFSLFLLISFAFANLLLSWQNLES